MNAELELLIAVPAFVGALGSGLVAGVFYAFSTFMMKALARLPEMQGMTAMQSINVVVLNRWFLGVFLGTAALSVFAAAVALLWWSTPGAPALLAGSVLYFAGSFLVTIVCNVPRNESLASIPAADPRAAEVWPRYLSEWTRWNHVRTAASLAATASFILALAA